MTARLSLLLVIVLTIGLVVVALYRPARTRRLQFGLRSLLVGGVLLSLVLSAVLSWNYWITAQTVWLDPSSPEADSLTPEPVISEGGLGYQATFRPRCRSIGELANILEKAKLPRGSSMTFRWNSGDQEATFEFAKREPLEARLSLLKASDVLPPGAFVIRGRVEDSLGRPVPNAMVDLMGPYVYVNYSQTRSDGTFLMPIKPPPGSGYYLRIRYDRADRRMDTRSFAIDPGKREMVVLIRVR